MSITWKEWPISTLKLSMDPHPEPGLVSLHFPKQYVARVDFIYKMQGIRGITVNFVRSDSSIAVTKEMVPGF